MRTTYVTTLETELYSTTTFYSGASSPVIDIEFAFWAFFVWFFECFDEFL